MKGYLCDESLSKTVIPPHGLNTDIDTKAFVSFHLKMAGRKVCGHLFTVQFTSNLYIIPRCILPTVQQPSRCLSTWAVVLHLDMSVYTRACATPVRVCLPTGAIVLPLEVSAICMSTRACVVPVQVLLCRNWTLLSTRACASPVRVCLQELLYCTWTCLFTRVCATPACVFFVLHL